MGYSWLITACYDYFSSQHAGASIGLPAQYLGDSAVERRCHHGVLMVDYCPLRLPLLSACRIQYGTGGGGGRL